MRLRVGPSVCQIKKSSALIGATFLLFCLSILYLVISGNEEQVPSATKQVFHIDKYELNALELRLQKLEHELQRNRDMLGQIRETVQVLLRGNSLPADHLSGHGRYKSFYQNPNRTYFLPLLEDCSFSQNFPADSDINLLDVYDTLKFDNPDGGVWKQGWKIEYDASQWTSKNKLKVFVVPHSHNDPGWLKTYEKYFNDQTRHILNNIATKLKEDNRRKFIWAEVSYLSTWWDTVGEDAKAEIKRYVKNGQLEIVTGGWVMNDEASTHYYAMIEQLVEGHQWLTTHLGYKPKNGWAIDPFGLSPTMAYLLRRMGLESMVIQRVHYAIKKYLAQHKSLEFFWRQAWDQNHTTDILCHMMPFYSYDVPHSCGPDPKICCQFDFKRLPGNKVNCPWRVAPAAITDRNVADKAWTLLDQYRKKSQLYRTNVVLVPLGDDFRYDKAKEWDQQFKNYQKLFDYMNTKEEWNVEAKFGTLEDYFKAVRESPMTNSRNVPSNFPSLVGDFFTYADRDDHYWSGYFTSRPFYKNMDRVFEAHLRAAEILFSLTWSSMGSLKISQPAFTKMLMTNLVESRRNLGLFQHHDAITGTAKDLVVLDYANRMVSSIQKLQKIISHTSLYLLASQNSHADIFDPDKMLLQMHDIRRHYSSLPEKILIRFSSELKVRTIVLFNSLGHSRKEVVTLRVSTAEVEVRDSSGTIVPAQISPIWAGLQTVDEEFELSFVAELPALSLMTYTISVALNPKTTFKAAITLYNFDMAPQSRHFHFVTPETPQELSIQSSYVMAAISGADGMLRKIVNKDDGQSIEVRIQFLTYSTRPKGKDRSGAYLFLPDTDAQKVKYSRPRIRVLVGPIYSDVTVFLPNVQHRIILKNSPGLDGIGLDIQNLVDITKETNKELVMRMYTNVTGNEFYTDLNGFQMVRRTTLEKIPLQGNVYPMPTMAYLQDNTSRLTLLTAQPLGVASLKPGWLEVFLDRRLNQDDNRGLQQGVTDNKQTLETFRLIVERPWNGYLAMRSPSSLSYPSLVSHHSLMSLLHPVFTLFKLDAGVDTNHGKLPVDVALQPSFSPLGMELPCDVHLVNLRTTSESPGGPNTFWPSNSTVLYLHRFGFDCSFKNWAMKCPTDGANQISIGKMFPQHFGQVVEETSLSLMYSGNTFSKDKEFHLPQMEVVSFKLSRR